MTSHEPRSSRSDAEIESLLEQFFAREMPAHYRSLTPTSLTPTSLAPTLTEPPAQVPTEILTQTKPAARQSSGVIVAILACVVVAVCFVLAPGHFTSSQPKPESTTLAQTEPVPGSPLLEQPKPVVPTEAVAETPNNTQPIGELSPPEYSVRTFFGPVEKQTLHTEHGPVERRTETVTTNLSVIDPDTDSKVDVTIQEFEIEIFGVPDEDEDSPETP